MLIVELAEEFMKRYVERRLRPSTVRGYQVNLYNHFLPIVLREDPAELDVDLLDLVTDELHDKGLSNRSIVYVHATVRKMCNYALKRGYIDRNPYDLFDLPRVNKYHHRVLLEDEMRRMIDTVRGTDLEVPVTMALCYGLRRGECLGIMPAFDLDVKQCTLHIQRTLSVEHKQQVITPCKTEESNRYILLRPEHVQLLQSRCQGMFSCSLTPMQLEHRFKQLLYKHDFPQIRFHDLRHSYATLMLRKGVNPKIVSSVLGHSGVDVTLDIYSHPDVSMQRRCLEMLF